MDDTEDALYYLLIPPMIVIGLGVVFALAGSNFMVGVMFGLYLIAWVLVPAIICTAIVGIILSPYYLYKLIRHLR